MDFFNIQTTLKFSLFKSITIGSYLLLAGINWINVSPCLNLLQVAVFSPIQKQPMIIAIEKDGHAIMLNDSFKTQKELTNAITRWNKKGYLVKYIRGI